MGTMSLNINKIIRPTYNSEQEYLSDSEKPDVPHSETLLLIDSPKTSKWPFVEIFSSPINKHQIFELSDRSYQVTTGMKYVIFSGINNLRANNFVFKLRQHLAQLILNLRKKKTGKGGNLEAAEFIITTIAFLLLLVLIYGTKIIQHHVSYFLVLLIPYYLYRMKHTYCGFRVHDLVRKEEQVFTTISDHALLQLPWTELCQLGTLQYKGRFPYRISLEEFLSDELSILSQIKFALRIPYKKRDTSLSADFKTAKDTMLTIRPAIINSYKDVVALIAIPDSCPDGAFLILPKPKHMEAAITEILSIHEHEQEMPDTQHTEDESIPVQEAEPEIVPKSEYDPTTTSYIDRQSSPELFRDWAARETKAVTFYKKYDDLREKHPDWSINAIVDTIDDEDSSFEKESTRHLKTYLTEREAREIFFAEYQKLRQENSELHPEETTKWIARSCPKKTVGKLVLDARKMLCLGAHYAEFFKLADDLKEAKPLNWQQISRKIQKANPKQFPFHHSVYHYHLLSRNAGNGSWQSKLP
ncbi:hypothetical protein P4B35_20855 [Pontiellaceae bacterium B12227]|nr:hypothetical protein [Pontiellaceae bacterium B12227]